VDVESLTMPRQANPTDYKHRLAASFDIRKNYDDEYTVSRATQLVELAQLKDGDSALDLATGTGIVAVLAARAVGAKGKVIGVDISPGMLDQARNKIRAEGLEKIELIEADIEKLNFEAESFDAILCSSALMWLTDIPATLRKCRTWLKTGGILAFSCYSESSFMIPFLVRACAGFGISLPNCNEALGRRERCYDLVREAGFDKIEILTQQLGRYLRRDDVQWRWANDSPWIDPRGNPFSELSSKQLGEIKAAYESEIDALASAQGFWHEVTMFLVIGRK
jgi:protein-L-isoaspartate(D-aspartate) O-methyltransferase